RKKNIGKPDEGKPHVRFDAGGAGKVKGGLAPSDEISVLYSTCAQTDNSETTAVKAQGYKKTVRPT
ncbi:hypothetical protein, partial [Paenibacillus sp.]|uniref:hypothetical protein n=1 Tax=Paenibacillus sp. TaxID=58172 RepID=UPI0035642DAA